MTQTDIFGYLYPNYKITKPIRLIELFAGIGTQAMALRDLEADFTRHRVVEMDPFAIKSYNAIHGTNFEPTDITTISADDLKITDTDRYEYIMIYSFPCQDLSLAGKGRGMEKGSGTRSSLLWEVERILLELKEQNKLPQALLMENVPEVIGAKNYQHFMKWYSSLEQIGYQSYYKLLNAKDYGVPQSRNRCFMISILGNYNYTFPSPVPLKRRLRDVLESEVDEKYYLSDDYVGKLLQRNKEQRDKGNGHIFKPKTENDISNAITTRQRGSSDVTYVIQIGNCVRSKTRENLQAGRVYATKGIAPTLNCMEGGNRQPMILQNSQGFKLFVGSDQRIRKLTPLECWRLMDYTDDDFRKAQAVNSDTQLYKQAGNGIVKAVLMAIFKELIQEEHMKPILDVCCGSKMFYFNRDNPLVHFNDKRELNEVLCDGRKLEIHPETHWDFRHLPVADNTYYMVVFDPPHLLKVGESSWLAKKYGKLSTDWKSYLKQGFDECMRVLKPYGALIFKWNETDIKQAELFEALETKPVFGDRGRGNKTYWFVFMKQEI